MIKQLLNSFIAKYRDLSVSCRSIICLSLRLRQTIDLRDTDKSRYFAITEFNDCLSFDHRVCFFNEYPWEGKRSAIFTLERSQEEEKHGYLYVWAEYYLQPNTVGWHWHEQTIICRQLFAGHVVGFRPMKRKKNLLRMIIWIFHANQTIQRRKKIVLCLLESFAWPRRLLTLGLIAEYRATLKLPLKIGRCVDTWILSHHVSAYPIHVSSSFDTFQGYCCEVERYSAVTLTLIVSGEPQGRHLLYFFSSGLSRLYP